MDAWLSGGASSAAVAGEAAEEAQHSTQAMDSDDGEHATDDVDAIVNVSVSGGHNGYLRSAGPLPFSSYWPLDLCSEPRCPCTLTGQRPAL